MGKLYVKERRVSEAELAACRRVGAYIRRAAGRHVADLSGDPAVEEKRQGAEPFVELYLVFYDSYTGPYDRAIVAGIRAFAAGRIGPAELKRLADDFIRAHSVVWIRGVPYWRVKEMEQKKKEQSNG